MPNMAGLIGPADRLSKAGLAAGLFAGVALAAIDLSVMLTSGEIPFGTQMHSLLLASIMLLLICSLMVQLAARVIRWLRRLSARFDALDDAMVGETPSPETVAAVRRLAFQVVHSRD